LFDVVGSLANSAGDLISGNGTLLRLHTLLANAADYVHTTCLNATYMQHGRLQRLCCSWRHCTYSLKLRASHKIASAAAAPGVLLVVSCRLWDRPGPTSSSQCAAARSETICNQ
jgi:hypothetical protein